MTAEKKHDLVEDSKIVAPLSIRPGRMVMIVVIPPDRRTAE